MITWNKKSVTNLLLSNDKAVERAILVVYNNQTYDEKISESTNHDNGIGFTGAHARQGTYYAKWILSGKHLTGKHLTNARKMSLKYTNQLLKEIVKNQNN